MPELRSQESSEFNCSGMNICKNCEPPAHPEGRCLAVSKYTSYRVSEYGSVQGAMNMKMEIYKRGPIGCGIQDTAKAVCETSCFRVIRPLRETCKAYALTNSSHFLLEFPPFRVLFRASSLVLCTVVTMSCISGGLRSNYKFH